MNVQQDDQNQTIERKDSGLAAIDLFKTRTPIGGFGGSQDFLIRIRNGKLVLNNRSMAWISDAG